MAENQNNIIPEERDTGFERMLKIFRISKFGGFLLGLVISLLLLYTSAISSLTAALIATGALLILAFTVLRIRFAVSRRYAELEGWGWLGMLILGFGVGTLIYMARGAWMWLWEAMLKIDTAEEVIRIGLFLFGVMMGVFVVRVWNKEQDEFLKSTTAFLGGAVLTPLLGKAANIDVYWSFGLYFLGAVISAPINIIACWWMISQYSRGKAQYLRSALDFMYGKDKADAVDKIFLENFFESRDSARLLIGLTLKSYRGVIKTEYAEKLQARWEKEKLAPHKKKIEEQMGENTLNLPQGGEKCTYRQVYYQLLAIKPVADAQAVGAAAQPPNPPDPNQPPPNPPPPNAGDQAPPPKLFDITYRRIDQILPEMFRVGVTVKVAENLEYVIAPGTFGSSFPVKGSIAGLALNSRRIVVMDRDLDKLFPSNEVLEGRTPKQMQQPRGFQEGRYLSYISIPIVSDLGNPEELEIGVVNVDSVLFATANKIGGDEEPEVSTARFTLEQLRAFASNLYDELDEPILSIGDLVRVIEPILRLYLLARQGTS